MVHEDLLDLLLILVPLGQTGRGRRDSLHFLYPCASLYTQLNYVGGILLTKGTRS